MNEKLAYLVLTRERSIWFASIAMPFRLRENDMIPQQSTIEERKAWLKELGLALTETLNRYDALRSAAQSNDETKELLAYLKQKPQEERSSYDNLVIASIELSHKQEETKP